ncbi:MAG: hypothetical protein Q9167_000160, partial [Letrouitia subvulpina]
MDLSRSPTPRATGFTGYLKSFSPLNLDIPFVTSSMEITAFIASQRDKALLLGDYGSYRKQLSRRLLVVRKKLNRSTKGRKYGSQPPVTAEDVASNPEFIHLLLLTSERAWALAMHMKSTHSAGSGGELLAGSTRRHIISRFHKATIYARHLVGVLEDQKKTETNELAVLEAWAYLQSLRGAIELEKRNWEACLSAFAEVRFIYAALARNVGAKKDDHFRDWLSSTIDPGMRYAAYKLRIPRTTSIEAIVAQFLARSKDDYIAKLSNLSPQSLEEPSLLSKEGAGDGLRELPKTISWRSRTVSLEDAATAQALALVSVAEQNLASFLESHRDSDPRTKAAAYDQVLLPSQDAVDANKTAIDEMSAEGLAQGDPRMQSLHVTRTAVNFALVGWRIGRNRVLCGEQDGASFNSQHVKPTTNPKSHANGRETKEESIGRKLSKLRERTVLYEAIFQSLDSVQELPGVAADQALITELDSSRAYFMALRCLAISRSHSLLESPKKALALLSRAIEYSSQIKTTVPSSHTGPEEPRKLQVDSSEADALNKILQGLVLRQQALVELENLNKKSKGSMTTGFPAIENLEEYPPNGVDLKNLVTYPPKLQPIPVKPIFLDVAWNYIEYPGRKAGNRVEGEKAKTEESIGSVEEKKETRKGWFGF